MSTTILMRCTTPHWQGNKFIDAGTVRPQGHPEAIPAFFEPFVVEESTPKPAKVEPAKVAESKPKSG
jgi:hypothetical protein